MSPIPSIDISMPDSSKTRVELTIAQVTKEWSFQSRGELFSQALIDFFRSLNSENTLRVYTFSILEFFEWYMKERGSVPTPDRVRRADAIEFVRWLQNRDAGLEGWRLEMDSERRMDRAIFDFVQKKSSARVSEIRKYLLGFSEFCMTLEGKRILQIDLDKVTKEIKDGLSRHLACLVYTHSLTRVPSVDQIRKVGVPEAGIDPIPQYGIDKDVSLDLDPDVFVYSVPIQKRSKGASRSVSISTRIASLTSFWGYLSEGAENAGYTEPLIKHNIWKPILSDVMRHVPSFREASRSQKTPGIDVFLQLLATTYSRTHNMAFDAAQEAIEGIPVHHSDQLKQESFDDLRDRFLLLLMFQTGLRASEITKLKRRDLSTDDPPILTVIGKGDKIRRIVLPRVAHQAFEALGDKLESLAVSQRKYKNFSRALELLDPDAPLVPAISYWGNNNKFNDSQGITSHGIAMMLRRRAQRAGIDPGTPIFLQVHPHGFRHLFAKTAADSGTPLHRLQAIMGHSNISVTGLYVTERDPSSLIAEPFKTKEQSKATQIIDQRQIKEESRTYPIKVQELRVAKPRLIEQVSKEEIAQPEFEEIEVSRTDKSVSEIESRIKKIEKYRGKNNPLSSEQSRLLRKCASIKEETKRNLCMIYVGHWGEEGNRSPISSTGTYVRNERTQEEEASLLSEAFADVPEEELSGLKRVMEVSESGELAGTGETWTKKLRFTYSGKESGLLWWDGTTGKLRPQFPVISQSQLKDCSESSKDSVCSGLVDLWKSYVTGNEPSKADALSKWFVESLDLSFQIEEEIIRKNGAWVSTLDSWKMTSESGENRRFFRMHDNEEILNWFKVAGWRYRASAGRDVGEAGKDYRPTRVIDEWPPDWYSMKDPLDELSPEERSDALDWILVLSGQMPIDRIPRFKGSGSARSASREELARLIDAMNEFDMYLDQEYEIKRGKWSKSGVQGFTIDESFRNRKALAAKSVNDLVFSLSGGLSKDFDIEKEVSERVRKRKSVEGVREYRKDFYMKILDRIWGEKASNDFALKAFAYYLGKKKITLREERSEKTAPLESYQELFRVKDRKIVHDASLIREFAKKYGTHSECVARRIARSLWEMKKTTQKSKRDKILVDEFLAMLAFRVPCADEYEKELSRIVNLSTDKVPIYSEWKRAMGQEEAPKRGLLEMIYEEEGYGEASRMGTAREMYRKNPRARMVSYTANAMNALPTPIHLLIAAYS